MPNEAASAQDSPISWVNEHARRYVQTGGKDGHILQGLPTLLLTTVGRRSGRRRRTGATYGRRDRALVVVASAGGAPQHPQWYLNLLVNPEVEVQVGAEVFTARARVTKGVEQEELWQMMCAMSPLFAELQQRTSREFPIVVLERTAAPASGAGAGQTD